MISISNESIVDTMGEVVLHSGESFTSYANHIITSELVNTKSAGTIPINVCTFDGVR